MTSDRWELLMHNDSAELNADEIKAGWHFCHEFDGLLVGPGMGETKNCTCFATNQIEGELA